MPRRKNNSHVSRRNMLVGLGFGATSFSAAGNPFQGLPYCLAINRDGKRYTDESRSYVVNGKATLKQPGQTIALIFDEEIRKMSDVATSFGIFQRLQLPIPQANTLEELAPKIDAPPAALVETVKEFNDAVKDEKAVGITPPKMALAKKVQTPPFYAFYPLVPGITLTFG